MAKKYDPKEVNIFINGIKLRRFVHFEVEQRPSLKAGPIEYLRFQGYAGADESALLQ